MGEHYRCQANSVIVLRVVSAANTSGFFLFKYPNFQVDYAVDTSSSLPYQRNQDRFAM